MNNNSNVPMTYYQNSRVSNQPYQMIEEEGDLQFYNEENSNPLEGTTKIN